MHTFIFLAALATSPFTYTPSWTSTAPSDLVEGQGSVEVDTQINSFESISPNVPIEASVMITHPSSSTIDDTSFLLGDKMLKVEFVRTIDITPNSNIVLSIYKFQIPGTAVGQHTLPPVKVKVGGKVVESRELVYDVGGE